MPTMIWGRLCQSTGKTPRKTPSRTYIWTQLPAAGVQGRDFLKGHLESLQNPDARFPPKAGWTGPEGLRCAVGVRTISLHRRWTKRGTGDGLGKNALVCIQIFLLSSQGKYSRCMNSNIYYLLL